MNISKILKKDLTGIWKKEQDNTLQEGEDSFLEKDNYEVSIRFGTKKTNKIIIIEDGEETKNTFDGFEISKIFKGKFTITLTNYKNGGKKYIINCSNYSADAPNSFIARITKYGERVFVKQ